MLSHNVGVNSAPHVPTRCDARKSWRNGRDDFVEHVIGHLLMERADIAEAPHVHLERFEFDAKLIGDVLNREVREVGLTGERAVSGELGNLDVDQIVPS